MYIAELKNGTFTYEFMFKGERIHEVAKFIDENGDFVRYATSRGEAEEIGMLYRSNLRQGKRKAQKSKNVLYLGELIKLYIEDCNINNIKTAKTYCGYLLNFIIETYKKDIPIKDITKLDIIRYRKWRLNQPIMKRTKAGKVPTGLFPKASTINREINTLQGMFTWIIDISDGELLEKNPCSKLEKLAEDIVTKPVMTDELEKMAFEQVDGTYFYELLYFFFETGMRMSEVLNQLWDNIHFEKVGSFEYGHILVIDTKTNDSREIPMSKELRDMLSKMPRLSKYVFTNPNTGTKYVNIRKRLDTILKKLNIKKRGVGFHIFRAWFARKCEDSGATTTDLQDLLGHKDRKSTEHYTKINKKYQASIIYKNNERTKINISKD